MASLGMHPRLAHMVLRARDLGCGALACQLAALLGERDILTGQPGEQRDSDIRRRVETLRSGDQKLWSVRQVAAQARQWQRQLGIAAGTGNVGDTGRVLALAYPDRIAQRRPGSDGQYRLSNGRGAFFLKMEPLAAEDFLAVADLDGAKREARIFLAAPLTLAEIEEDFADTIETVEFVAWDSREEAVLARRQRRLGELVLKDEPLPDPGGARTAQAFCQGIRELGLAVLPWTRELENFRARVEFLRRFEPEGSGWPDLSDDALLASLEDWLAPFLTGTDAPRPPEAAGPRLRAQVAAALGPAARPGGGGTRPMSPFRADRASRSTIPAATCPCWRCGFRRCSAWPKRRSSPMGGCRWCSICCRRPTGRCR